VTWKREKPSDMLSEEKAVYLKILEERNATLISDLRNSINEGN